MILKTDTITLIIFFSIVIIATTWGIVSRGTSERSKNSSSTSSIKSSNPSELKGELLKRAWVSFGWLGPLMLRFTVVIIFVGFLQLMWRKYIDPISGPNTSYTTTTWSRNSTSNSPVEKQMPEKHIYNFSDPVDCPNGRCPVQLGCDEFCWGTAPIGGDIVLEIQKGSVFERIGIDHLKDGNGTFGFIDPNPRLYYLRAATREESEVNSLATGVIVYWYKTGY